MRQRGFSLLELIVITAIIAIIASIAIPNLNAFRRGANESSAEATLREIFRAQTSFQTTDLDADGQGDFAASIDELVTTGALAVDMTRKHGYGFTVTGDLTGFSGIAQPLDPPRVNGLKAFFIDQSGVVRFEPVPGDLPTETSSAVR